MNRRPKRVQLSRAKGWRKPEGAIVVARPTRWGNPWKVGEVLDFTLHLNGDMLTVTRELAVALHRADILEHGDLDEIRAVLGGHDLCCWCPLDQPCHCDTLLELANPRPNITITNYPTPGSGGLFGGGFPPGAAGGMAGVSMVAAMSAHDNEIRRDLAIRQQRRGGSRL